MVTVFQEGAQSLVKPSTKQAILVAIPTRSVYVSIDKDVLNEADAITNWDQGNMKLGQLLDLLGYMSLNNYAVVCRRLKPMKGPIA